MPLQSNIKLASEDYLSSGKNSREDLSERRFYGKELKMT